MPPRGGSRRRCRTTVAALDSERVPQEPAGRRSWCFPASIPRVPGEIEGAFAQSGPRHRQQLAQLPHGSGRAVVDSGSERGPPRAAEGAEATRGWTGRIVTNPNCVVIVYAMALAPLRQFGLKNLDHHDAAGNLRRRLSRGCLRRRNSATSFRSSAAARRRKSKPRRNKILGTLKEPARNPRNHPLTVSAVGTRVPVHNGHTGIHFRSRWSSSPDSEAMIAAWNRNRGRPQELNLPSAPPQPIVYVTEPNRPQPALDANRDGGMTVDGRTAPALPGARRQVRRARPQHD